MTPPPFGTFPKIHPFWKGKASLNQHLKLTYINSVGLLQLSLLKWFVINIYPLYHVYYVYWSNNLSGKFLYGIWKLGPDWPDMIMRPPGLRSNHSDLLEMLNVSKKIMNELLKTPFCKHSCKISSNLAKSLFSRIFRQCMLNENEMGHIIPENPFLSSACHSF